MAITVDRDLWLDRHRLPLVSSPVAFKAKQDATAREKGHPTAAEVVFAMQVKASDGNDHR